VLALREPPLSNPRGQALSASAITTDLVFVSRTARRGRLLRASATTCHALRAALSIVKEPARTFLTPMVGVLPRELNYLTALA
jgi:hypothetical protein